MRFESKEARTKRYEDEQSLFDEIHKQEEDLRGLDYGIQKENNGKDCYEEEKRKEKKR